jgi:mannitol-1-/sugar-/sorbitol-6-phosphatase
VANESNRPGESPFARVDAIIFDCDGVLVDSAASVDRSWARWAERYGLDGATVLEASNGRTSPDTVATWLQSDLVAEGCALIEEIELADAGTVRMIPGAMDLLASLPVDHWAIVTSASAQLFDARIRAAGLPRPRVVITADDVIHGKPHREGYASALRRLGVSGRRAAVFEDTAPGIAAAHAAGVAWIVRVGTGDPVSPEAAVVPDLRQVTWEGGLRLLR